MWGVPDSMGRGCCSLRQCKKHRPLEGCSLMPSLARLDD